MQPEVPRPGAALVEPGGIEDDDQLNDWIEKAIAFVKVCP